MAFKFTSDIKVAVLCTDGELVFVFKRPDMREKNEFLAKSLDIKTEGAARLNDLDAIRLAMFDKYAIRAYVEKDGKQDEIVTEDGSPMPIDAFPNDIKLKAAARAFEYSAVIAKNF